MTSTQPSEEADATTSGDATTPDDVERTSASAKAQRSSSTGTSQDISAWSQDSGGASNVKEGSRVIIIGGGPGGYEAALVARHLGAQVLVIERTGMGGAAVLTDVVPSKTLIATAEWLSQTSAAQELGISFGHDHKEVAVADLAKVNARVKELAQRQSEDIRDRLIREGVQIVEGEGRLGESRAPRGFRSVIVRRPDGTEETIHGHVLLLATGATPRELPSAQPDGERILTWKQLYELEELPEHLIVVGSGVTGAEFASAYRILGSEVTLISSRDQVLPGFDTDAAEVIETIFEERGMTVLNRCRAQSVVREGDKVIATLTDGRTVEGSHCLMAVGSIPNTEGLNLERAGVRQTDSGHIEVDRVSRTTISRVYAAGDCTGVLPLASVAAMQGRIAMWHALGDAVNPLNLSTVASNIFTLPEIATVGVPQERIDSGEVDAEMTVMRLSRNPRSKMLGQTEGFLKLFAARPSGRVIGGVVVSQRAGEYIFPISLAMTNDMTVDDISKVLTIYPSVSGSLAEAARVLQNPEKEF